MKTLFPNDFFFNFQNDVFKKKRKIFEPKSSLKLKPGRGYNYLRK